MKKRYIIGMLAGAALVCAHAVPIVSIDDNSWGLTDPSPVSQWSIGPNAILGGRPASQITYTFDGPAFPETLITTTQPSAMGNWNTLGGQGVDSLSFNFYMGNLDYGMPALTVYFTGAGGISWYYDVTPPSLSQGWNSFHLSLTNPGWFSGGDDPMATTMAGVTQIGFELFLSQPLYTQNQIFGISDFTLHYDIPEPHEWAMIIFAMLALCTLYRRELQARLDAALAKVRS